MMQQTHVQQHVFNFTAMYHVVLFMAYAHTKSEQYVLCVPLKLVLNVFQSIHTKGACVLLETLISESHGK